MICKNKIRNLIIILCCIILTQFILIICIVNKKPEVVIKEVKIVEKVPVEVEPTYMYNVTSVEREMLARIVYLEANTESIECQKAVVSVVINRLKDGYWGDTLHNVIYAESQFTPATKIYKTTPTETNYEAVDYVLRYGCTIPEYVKFFRRGYHFNWDGYVSYDKIDNTCFGYLIKDKK